MIRIVCTDESGNCCTVSIDAQSLVEELQILIEVELGVLMAEQQIIAANGKVLRSDWTLAAQGIHEDTSVTVRRPRQENEEKEEEKKEEKREEKRETRPRLQLAEANALIERMFREGAEGRRTGTPFNEADPEVQRRIYDEIYWENVNENLKTAHEFAPEVFVAVHMLFVSCEINGVTIKAFIDSGAQASIINVRTAEKCGLMRLLDTRATTLMRGVGVRRSRGRIHMAIVNLGGLHIPFSFNVIDDDQMNLIIGLDQLKRHRMLIDLKDNCLRIEDVRIPFLSESEVPSLITGREVEDDDARLEPSEKTGEHQPRPASAVGATTITAEEEGEASGEKGPTALRDTDTAPAPDPGLGTGGSGANREEGIAALMMLAGIDRERAVALLQAADWNVTLAASLLLDD